MFGVPLEVLVEREGADSPHGASSGVLRVPSFLDILVSEMRQVGKFHSVQCISWFTNRSPTDMLVSGIFRKSGNIRVVNRVIDAVNKDPTRMQDELRNIPATSLASLLKKFLTGLPEPLMTSKLSDLFVFAASK